MRASEVVYSLLAGLLIVMASTPSPSQSADTRAAPYEREHSPPIFSQSGAGEDAGVAFLVALQKAVASNDRRKVASMIHYPIVAWARKRDILFKTPASLLASYELIFTPRLKKIIAEARWESLFRNWQGVMIHNGEIWFNDSQERGFKIIAINRPIGEGEDVKSSRRVFKAHPKVFNMIECWTSDSESPVVTEINLDAVAQNRNQFDPDEIKQYGEWIRCDTEEGRGFMRYRTLKTVGNHYTVEYQNNVGGTLTTATIIEFVIEKRQLRKDGKPTSIRVLRVLAFSFK